MISDRQYKEKAAEILSVDARIMPDTRPEVQRVKGSGAFVTCLVWVSDEEFAEAAPPKDLLAEGREP